MAAEKINHGAVTPLYKQLAAILRTRVADLRRGQLLPSEANLAREYQVAPGTVRKALEILREEGLVVTEPGRGTGRA
jgi:DNA-binding GntR family transcriptional regulator